jgi:hypothetical protein
MLFDTSCGVDVCFPPEFLSHSCCAGEHPSVRCVSELGFSSRNALPCDATKAYSLPPDDITSPTSSMAAAAIRVFVSLWKIKKAQKAVAYYLEPGQLFAIKRRAGSPYAVEVCYAI